MRVLVAHCQYRQRGGEDAVFEAEVGQLSAAGHDTHVFLASNHEMQTSRIIDRLRVAVETSWSFTQAERLRSEIRRIKPQVVHFHNTFPQVSPRAYRICKEEKVRVVQTLHNYRLICSNAMLLRNGKVCQLCINGNFAQSVVHRCYRDSRLASGAVAAMQYIHHRMGTFSDYVDKYIALTEFAKLKFIEAGVPAHKLTVKPNSLSSSLVPGDGSGGYALFVGRLSAEKGVLTLLEAWRQIKNIPLKIVGEGPLFENVRRRVSFDHANIEVLGPKSSSEVMQYMGDAALLVVPSEWFEGFPMTIVEAYARSTPVLASRIGALIEIVEENRTGMHFNTGDPNALADAVRCLFESQGALRALRRSTRDYFLDRFTEEKNVLSLERIYSEVLEDSNN